MSEIYQHLSSVYNELNYNTFKQKIYQNMLHLKLKLETELDMDFKTFKYFKGSKGAFYQSAGLE